MLLLTTIAVLAAGAALEVEGANILILHPLYAGSHDLVLRLIGDRLVSRGHTVTQVRYAGTNMKYDLDTNVTVMTLKIDDSRYPCPRYINRNGEFDIQNREMNLGPIIWNKADAPFTLPTDVYCVTHVHCQMILEDQTLFKQLKALEFDLAIVDLIANECSLALARALGLPVATFWGFGFQGGEVMHTSNWNPPSLVPAFMSGLDRHMNFWERCVNMAYTLGHVVLEDWQTGAADVYIKKLFPELIDSATLIHGIDLALVHTNFFVDYPRLVAPNTKYVGGMHIRDEPIAPLPLKFAEFVESADDGIILFSLGYTGFEPRDVPTNVVTSFIKAFAKLSQKVIMRFDASLVTNIPDNVMIVDWFPQHDLLIHPNTVLFVSHCGMNGVLESIYHRVPILAMPIFADQPDNAARIVERGLGLAIDRHTITEKVVTKAIRKILDNPKYQRKVNLFADMWRDQDRSGFDEAIYWIELLIKYGSFEHLQINDHELNILQYLSIDVVCAYIMMSLLLLVMLLKTLLICLSRISMNLNTRVERQGGDRHVSVAATETQTQRRYKKEQ